MSLLTIVQKFALRTGQPKPATVMGNTDVAVLQMLTLLEEECQELAQRGPQSGLTNEVTFVSVANESQGTLASLGTNGLRYIVNRTFWNRTKRLPVSGPVSDVTWQGLKAMSITGPFYQYRLRGVTTGGQATLLINPVPAVGETYAFEYITDNWCISGATPGSVFTLDADTILLPESVVTMGLRWRWKKEKGLTYAEDFATYEGMVANYLGRDGTKPTLRADGAPDEMKPGIFIPDGNWPL